MDCEKLISVSGNLPLWVKVCRKEQIVSQDSLGEGADGFKTDLKYLCMKVVQPEREGDEGWKRTVEKGCIRM